MTFLCRLLCGCALLAMTFTSGFGCSCQESHPQRHFCTSDFVLRVQVLSELYESPDGSLVSKLDDMYDNSGILQKIYIVNVIQAFKSPANVGSSTTQLLYTSSFDSLCGITLTPGMEYIVSGRVYDRKMRVTLCSWNQPWGDLTDHQRNALTNGEYEQACACETKTCYQRGCWSRDAGADACYMELTWPPSERLYGRCLQQESLCTRDAADNCSWRISSSLNHCMGIPTISTTGAVLGLLFSNTKYSTTTKTISRTTTASKFRTTTINRSGSSTKRRWSYLYK